MSHRSMGLQGLLENSFTFYIWFMFVPHRKYTYGCPWPVTGIALFEPQRKHAYSPPRPVTGTPLLLICWCSYITGNTHMGLQGLLQGKTLLFTCWWCSYLTRNTAMGLHGLLQGIALLFICSRFSFLTGNTPIGLQGLLRKELYFLHVDDVRTSQETHLWASTACDSDSFTFSLLYSSLPLILKC
jgi:hypothetical protein